MKKKYYELLAQAITAGFEVYAEGFSRYGVNGVALAAPPDCEFHGDVITLWENGSFEFSSQFPNTQPKFMFK